MQLTTIAKYVSFLLISSLLIGSNAFAQDGGDGGDSGGSDGPSTSDSAAAVSDGIATATDNLTDAVEANQQATSNLVDAITDANNGKAGPQTLADAEQSFNQSNFNLSFAYGNLAGVMAANLNITVEAAFALLASEVGTISNSNQTVAPVAQADPTIVANVVSLLTTDPNNLTSVSGCSNDSNCLNSATAIVGQLINGNSGAVTNPLVSDTVNVCTMKSWDAGIKVIPVGGTLPTYGSSSSYSCTPQMRKCTLVNGVPILSGSESSKYFRCEIREREPSYCRRGMNCNLP